MKSKIDELPLEEKVMEASVIALARYEEREGKLVSIISEILKKDPAVTFHYQVGDDFGYPGEIRENSRYGEGKVIFFVGSPADMRTASAIHEGRIAGEGGMPLERFREMVAEL